MDTEASLLVLVWRARLHAALAPAPWCPFLADAICRLKCCGGGGKWQEIIAALARFDSQDPSTEARIEAARSLTDAVFVAALGHAPTSPTSGEGPVPSSEHTVQAAATASAAAEASAVPAAAAEADGATAGAQEQKQEQKQERKEQEEATADAAAAAQKEAEAEAAAAAEQAAAAAEEAAAAAAQKQKEAAAAAEATAAAEAAAAAEAKKKEAEASAAAAQKQKEEAAAAAKKKEEEAKTSAKSAVARDGGGPRDETGSQAGDRLEPERPGESLRDAFARRLSAGGKDGKTPAQELAQIEWDLKQLEVRTDNLNERVPQVVEYVKTLPPPSKAKRGKGSGAQGGPAPSAAMSQLEELRLKRLGRWKPPQNAAAPGATAVRAGALGEGDEREGAVRQLETMTKLCTEYAELGMMLMVCACASGAHIACVHALRACMRV